MNGMFMPLDGAEGSLRECFHRLVNAREDPACLEQARAWLAGLLAQTQEAAEQAALASGGAGLDDPGLLAFHAPVALLEGAWLQSLALAANALRPEAACLHAAYLALLGKDEAASPAFAYRGRLARAAIRLPPAKSWRFAHDPRLGAAALRFAMPQLALGFHAAEFLPETLGFTLAYLDSPSPWRLAALPCRQTVLAAMAEHAQAGWQAFQAGGGDAARLARGRALYQAAEADYLAALCHYADSGANPAKAVADMFQRKRRFARGYHGGVTLGGRGLEDWLAAPAFDAPGFLQAFAASPYAGPAFERLNAFGGPMFGVFSREELDLIAAWLKAGTEATPVAGETDAAPAELRETPVFGPQPGPAAMRAKPGWRQRCQASQRRGLFHALLRPCPDAETLAAARRQLETTLARPARPPFDYSPPAFAAHLAQIHDQETAKHQAFKPPPRLGREDYVFVLRQFAPAVLVDGCWLQHLGEAASQDSRLHRLPHRIHAEELGEGRLEWNHPKLYRDLLEETGIGLPALETWEFAHDPGFLDSAFDLPCHLLAISHFPQAYLPELLGLNLAIELSGLGAGYLRLAEELNHWGINPLIVRLHLSIDNLACGHAAMAAEAIQLYLDEMRELGGNQAVATAWRRIWAGRASLAGASRRFKWALLLALGRRIIGRKIHRREEGME